MDDTVKQDMDKSAAAFKNLVWPIVLPVIGGGDLLQMENVKDSNFAKILDIKAGIDGWQIHRDGMQGIASRIQQGEKAWNTFTIRLARDSGAQTEYEKRRIAIKTGMYIYPYLTIQAYVKTWKGPLLSVGIAKTADIIEFIKRGLNTVRRTTNATFAVCVWQKIKVAGYRVAIL